MAKGFWAGLLIEDTTFTSAETSDGAHPRTRDDLEIKEYPLTSAGISQWQRKLEEGFPSQPCQGIVLPRTEETAPFLVLAEGKAPGTCFPLHPERLYNFARSLYQEETLSAATLALYGTVMKPRPRCEIGQDRVDFRHLWLVRQEHVALAREWRDKMARLDNPGLARPFRLSARAVEERIKQIEGSLTGRWPC